MLTAESSSIEKAASSQNLARCRAATAAQQQWIYPPVNTAPLF